MDGSKRPIPLKGFSIVSLNDDTSRRNIERILDCRTQHLGAQLSRDITDVARNIELVGRQADPGHYALVAFLTTVQLVALRYPTPNAHCITRAKRYESVFRIASKGRLKFFTVDSMLDNSTFTVTSTKTSPIRHLRQGPSLDLAFVS